jgi:pyruvate formate lyase activating enzyme
MRTIHGIKGFLGLTLVDYPGKVAAVVFLGGCNLRCPFCQNPSLVKATVQLPDLELPSLLDSLNRRRKLIEGVVVTGGEPTVHPHVLYLLRELRTLGLAIKLDTNGLRPPRLREMVKENLVDYFAMDLKTAPMRYPAALGAPADAAQRLRQSVDYLRQCGVDYEFRTTCVPGFVGEEDMLAIGRFIQGAPRYYLQQYVAGQVLDAGACNRPPYPHEVLERFQTLSAPYVQRVELRSVTATEGQAAL